MPKSKPSKPKTIELVKSTYQPTKAEVNEPICTDASFEEAVKATLQPVKIRWIDKPRDRR